LTLKHACAALTKAFIIGISVTNLLFDVREEIMKQKRAREY
jgi:hypothetical protein